MYVVQGWLINSMEVLMKFRIYDKVKNEYCTHKENWMVSCFGNLVVIDNNKDGFQYSDPDRYTVEFSTDFPDKNGVEIFEGDKIKCEHEQNILTVKEMAGFHGWQQEFDFESNSIEIVGTIHYGGN